MQTYFIITFKTTTQALIMERKAKAFCKPGRIIPLPVSISAGCGLCWASDEREEAVWEAFCREQNIIFEQMTEITF